MNTWLKKVTRARWIVAASLGVIVCVWLWAALSFWVQYRSLHQQSRDLIPRIARLSGLAESESVLQAAGEQAHGQLQLLVYGDAGDASAMMQQQVRQVMERAGLTVAGSQILTPRVESLFTRLQLDLTATGSIETLEIVLQELGDLRPLVMVDSLQVQPVRTRARRGDTSPPEQALTLRIRLSSLRLQP